MLTRNHLSVLILLVCCAQTVPARAQSSLASTPGREARNAEIGIPYLKNFSPKDYNADAQNWAIVQDRRGVMYFGNNSGVLEYDGVSWRAIPVANGSAVRALALDGDGRIYVGAQGEFGYLAPAQEDNRTGQVQYVSLRDSVPAEYRDFADIAKCYVTSSGVYFQALDRLFLWPRHGSTRVWKPEMPFHLSFVVRDHFYIRQPGVGLLQMLGDSLQLAPDGEKFAHVRIYFMAPAGDDKIMIGTREQGLFWYDGAVARPFATEVDAFLLEHQIYHGEGLPNGDFALGTLRGGAAIIAQDGKLRQLLNKTAGIQDEVVRFVYTDRQDGLWLALDNGITRAEALGLLSHFDERAGVVGSVQSILRHKGRLYVATGSGVSYLQPSTAERDRAILPLPVFKPVMGIIGESWNLLSAGEALLAAVNDGVYQIHGEQAELIRSWDEHSLALYCSKIDTARVYVGLRDGLAAMRRSGTQWSDEGKITGVDEEIRSILETPGGLLWLGTRSQGYIRVDFSAGFVKNPKIERYDSRHGLPKKLGLVTAFALGDREVFATEGGIYSFDQKTNRFFPDSTFAVAQGNETEKTGEVVPDQAGNIWMQLAKKRKEIGLAKRHPDGAYDWQSAPLNPFADFAVWDICPEGSGVIWFGGPDGLIRYDANIEKDYAVDFTALIRKVMTIKSDSLLYDGESAMQSGTAFFPILDHDDNSLRFEFAAASYDGEAGNQFQYFLEGFDANWSEWTRETKKDYTNIFEGRYRFRVRAKNIYDYLSAEAIYSFKILPPWYRAWWAYIFYAGAIGFAIYSFIRYRTRQLVQRSRTLEKTVQQRTEEIRQQAEELETLDGIVRNINQEVVLESVLRSLLEQGLKLFPQAEKASVLLYDHASGRFEFAAAAGYDLGLLKNISFSPEQLASRYTMSSEEVGEGVYIVRNLQNLYIEEERNAVSRLISVLAMTVVREGKTEAYLVFDNLSSAEAFSHSDARKLSRFRSHAISAMVKAKILQELQEKNVEIIRTQQQLVMQEKLASLGALTAGIAHEIKNPLNFVNNFAELSVELVHELCEEIEQQTGKIESRAAAAIADTLRTLQQNAQKINEHGKRADSIVRGMLQHSRTQAGEREGADINALVQQAVNLSYHGMRAQEAGFNISIQENYDAAVGIIEAMPQDLSRVFLNIINNACYAAQQKKKKLEGTPLSLAREAFAPTLSVRTKSLGDKVEIRIRDNGDGIPGEVRNKIFNPFFTTKPTGQGTGLGLSISYDIIQQHGGEISVETEEGNYTEFILHLPTNGKR